MRALAVVVARAASKRLPRKNTLPLLGTPLVGWAVRAALASAADRVIVSTEDPEIAAIARQFGADVPFVRPDALASDYARSDEILLHALESVENEERRRYPVVVYIQPTTPFMLPRDIDACIGKIRNGEAACCFTARQATEPPWWMFWLEPGGRARPVIEGSIEGDREHSQKLTAAYFPSGAAWALNTDAFRAQRRIYCEPLQMVLVADERSIDIDDAVDWMIAETLAQRYGFTVLPARERRVSNTPE